MCSGFIQPVLNIHFFLKKATPPQPTCRHAGLLPQEVVNTATRAAGSRSLSENKLSHSALSFRHPSPNLLLFSHSHVQVFQCRRWPLCFYTHRLQEVLILSQQMLLFSDKFITCQQSHHNMMLRGRALENAGIVKIRMITRC